MSRGRLYWSASSKRKESAFIQVDWAGKKFRVMEWGIVMETETPQPLSVLRKEDISASAATCQVMRWIWSCRKRGLTLGRRSLEWESSRAKH